MFCCLLLQLRTVFDDLTVYIYFDEVLENIKQLKNDNGRPLLVNEGIKDRAHLSTFNFFFWEIFVFYCPSSLFGYCPVIRIDFCVILWKNVIF